MKNRLTYMLVGCLAITSLCSCTDQRDLFVDGTPLVKVESDWGRARITPDLVTIMFYSIDNNYTLAYPTNNFTDIVSLPSNRYNSLIVNGSLLNGLDNLRFRGTDKYHTFEAYATEKPKENGTSIVNEPEILAATTVQKEILTEKEYFLKYKDGKNGYYIPGQYVGDSILYRPTRLTYTIRVTAELVNNNHLFASRPVSGRLFGFSGSVFVATRMPSHEAVINTMTFPNTNLPDAVQGEITTTFVSFGPPRDLAESRAYRIYLTFTLKNGMPYYFSQDVSDQVADIILRIEEYLRNDADIEPDLHIRLRITIPQPGNEEVVLPPWQDDEIEVIPI